MRTWKYGNMLFSVLSRDSCGPNWLLEFMNHGWWIVIYDCPQKTCVQKVKLKCGVVKKWNSIMIVRNLEVRLLGEARCTRTRPYLKAKSAESDNWAQQLFKCRSRRKSFTILSRDDSVAGAHDTAVKFTQSVVKSGAAAGQRKICDKFHFRLHTRARAREWRAATWWCFFPCIRFLYRIHPSDDMMLLRTNFW